MAVSVIFIAITLRIALHPGVSYSTVTVVPLLNRTLVFFWARFWAGVILLFYWLWWVRMTLLVMTTFWVTFWRLPTGRFLTSSFRADRWWLTSSFMQVYSTHPPFWRPSETVILIFHGGVRLTSHKCRHRTQKWGGGQQLLQLISGDISV